MALPFFASCGEGKSSVHPVDIAELDGSVADLTQATGIGVRAKEKSAEKVALYSRSVKGDFIRFADNEQGGGSDEVLKNTELVKQEGDDFEEVKFSPDDGGEEFTLSEKGMQVTKLYSVGGLTFIALGSVTDDSSSYIKSVTELVMNTSYGSASVRPYGDGSHYFASVNYEKDGKKYSGYVPCRTYASDYFYEIYNYWNDDLNASFVIDNATGRVFDLGELFPRPSYISSVENGVLQVSGEYYDVLIDENGIELQKISVNSESQTIYTSVLKDKFGNFIFDTAPVFPVQSEQKQGNVIKVARAENKQNFLIRDCYRMGSDRRIYKFEISLYKVGQDQARGIFVLDENAEWQPVANDVNTLIRNRWMLDFMYTYGGGWVDSPRYSHIENGQLIMTNGFAGELEFTHWCSDFPSRQTLEIFYGAAAFSAENPLAHTAKGNIYDTDMTQEDLPYAYIMSGTQWFTVEDGTLYKNDVFANESEVIAHGVTDTDWDITGVLTVYFGETAKYILCDASGGMLCDSMPELPQRECIVFVDF